jgi:hypothetical protein
MTPADIERAEGPSRELDAEILASLGTHVLEKRERDKKKWWYKVGGRQYERIRPGIPRYTSSIDAALTLVPEGWHWMAATAEGDFIRGTASVRDRDGGPSFTSAAATPALAICAAALRAKEPKP